MLYSEAVNTFRVITYLWDGEVFHVPLALRIGQGGSYLDNAHAGGMFIGVNDLGELNDEAFTEFGKDIKNILIHTPYSRGINLTLYLNLSKQRRSYI